MVQSIMRPLLYLSLLLASTSCSTVMATRSPLDANKYELPYKFQCDGHEVFVSGVSHCQYRVGDIMRIKIKAPRSTGEIQVRSCRHSRSLDVDPDRAWQEIEWVQFATDDSCPIIMTVLTKDAGAQVGAIYPYVYDESFPKMVGRSSLYCWSTENLDQVVGQGNCQFPTGIKVKGFLEVDQSKSGEYLITSQCLPTRRESFQPGQAPIRWEMLKDQANFCPISLAVKYSDGTFEEQELYINFFDNAYRALPSPLLGYKGDRVVACAPQDYVHFDLNDRTRTKGLFQGKCMKADWKDGEALAIAWDKDGRVSSTSKKKDR